MPVFIIRPCTRCLATNEIIRRESKDKFKEALNIRPDYEYEYKNFNLSEIMYCRIHSSDRLKFLGAAHNKRNKEQETGNRE